MAQIPNTKTAPQDKDIAVIAPKTTGGTGAREQLSVVLDNLDQGLVNEIANRIADVNAEEARALAAEDVLQDNIDAEAAARIADVDAEEARALAAEAAEALARGNEDTILQNEIDGERQLLRFNTLGTTLLVSPAFNLNRITSSGTASIKLAVPNGSFASDFPGATIDFAAGTITYTGGTPSPGSFTPVDFTGQANKYFKYALVLLPTAPDTILVLPGESFGTTLANTPNPAFDGGIALGYVGVQVNGTATAINALVNANITQFKGSGSGSGGSGSGSVLDPSPESTWVYYTRNDFGVDKKKFVLATTGVDSILGLKKIVFTSPGNQMTTKDLTGLQVRKDGVAIQSVQAKLLYTNLKVDNPLVEFSRDGALSWVTATDVTLQSEGDIVLADGAFPTTVDLLANGDGTRGSTVTGTKLAAMYTPAYRQTIQSFDFLVGSASTTGSVTGSIYSVSSGTPQTLLGTAAEVYVANQDIVNTRAFKRFTMGQPLTLEAGTTYAFVLEGSGLNANILSEIVTDAGSFSVGSAAWIAGWTATANDIAFKVNGTGCDLRMRLTSTVAAAELLGFGVEYVEDAPLSLTGYTSYEERIITNSEASTGIVTLQACRYSVGAHQLQVMHKGHIYMAPDFAEISGNAVSFGAGFFIPGDVVRFYVGFGLVDASSQAISKIGSIYDVIVGSANQLATGIATHSSIASGLSALPANGKMLILKGTYTENVSVTANCMIEGQGYGTVINGTFSMSPNFSTVKCLKFGGNVTLSCQGSFVKECFIASTATVTETTPLTNKIEIFSE